MEWHPYAKLFPLLGAEALQALADDIKANGLRQPVVIDAHGRIIDGRNRNAACQLAGVTPVYEPFTGTDAEVLKLVISLNLHRRHLTDSQRSMVAAEVATLRHGQRSDYAESSIEDSAPPVSQQAAADMLHVSRTSVERATAVKKKGTDELKAAVVNGDITVSKAAEIANLPAVEQPAAINDYITNPPRQKPHRPATQIVEDDSMSTETSPLGQSAGGFKLQGPGWGDVRTKVCDQLSTFVRRYPETRKTVVSEMRNFLKKMEKSNVSSNGTEED